MKSRFFIGFLTLFTAFFMPFSALASENNAPSFPTCANPEGTLSASYSDGNHGIAGDQNTYSGQDSVYTLENGNAVQCFCNNETGVQTNWWNVGILSQEEIQNLENQGWIYVPDGSSWGLSDSAYMAYNIYGSCAGGTTSSNSSTTGGSTPYVCNDTVPSSAPVITNIVLGQNSATLTWTKAGDPVSGYYISYGVEPGKYLYGNPNVGNVTTYTVTNLSGNTTYYFIVGAVNGCKPGPFSSEVKGTANGESVSGIADNFAPITTNPDEVKAASAENTLGVSFCGRCFWWPILLVEGVLLVFAYYFLKKKKLSKIARFAPGTVVAVLAYVVFLIINNGKCPFGVMDFHFFTIPCVYFWAVDGVLFAVVAFVFKPKSPKTK